ncbi:MAG TPA: DUF397 domain-containing protein [Thermomonospora sp.]|nr:DUF397 domain-containing protein [Thermomonospora sp.]
MTEQWRKSSHSGTPNDPTCVEVAALSTGLGIRDSKDPHGGRLTVRPSAFGSLVHQIKTGSLNGT